MSTAKPKALPVNRDAIPVVLKRIRCWVVWRYVWNPTKNGGDWDKPPLTASGRPASSTNPNTWTDFAPKTMKRKRDPEVIELIN
jgi:primase-polymerase (primpol)-like protein